MAHLTLSNRGGGMLSGQVVSRVPWLRVRRSAFRCPAGASARIAVELLGGQIPPQAADATHLRRALIVSGGSFAPIFTRPVALILFLVIVLTVLSQVPAYKRFMRMVKAKALAPLISKIFRRRNRVDSGTPKN